MAVQYRAGGDIFGRLNINGQLYVNNEPVEGSVPPVGFQSYTFVNALSDFTNPVGGIITLEPNHAYYIVSNIDLLGSRLVIPTNVALIGASPESCSITSTGKSSSDPLISCNFGLQIQNIKITGNNVLSTGNTSGPNFILDLDRVRFENCQPVGTITNYENISITNSSFINCSDLRFGGLVGSVFLMNDRFETATSSTMMFLQSTLNISRDFVITYSTAISNPGETTLNISPSMSALGDSIISDSVNYVGGGTHLTGISAYDNRISLLNNRGIQNTTSTGVYSFSANAVSTPIANTTDFFKAAGNTVVFADINRRFTHTNNRLTYTGSLMRNFRASSSVSLLANNGQVIFIAIAKNGVVLPYTTLQSTIGGNNKAENISTMGVLELSAGDYVELFIRNSTATTPVTVEYSNFVINQI